MNKNSESVNPAAGEGGESFSAGASDSPGMETRQIPLELLLEADWNANRVTPALLARVRRSIERFGVVENLVARPHPVRGGCLEVLSGNHRLRVLRELGHVSAPVVVVDLDDVDFQVLPRQSNGACARAEFVCPARLGR
jgi:hypothetical protein